ncbi:unnamed protein product, partial [Hymenolepis diminuta]
MLANSLSWMILIFFVICLCKAYNPRILVIDMNGNENFLPDVAIPVAASISFLCRASDVKKNEFVWTRAYFSSQDYKMVKQSQSVVIDSRDGESKITLTDATFNKS